MFESENSPYHIEGFVNQEFIDPGVILNDNYYSQEEIEKYMNFQSGAHESAFGYVNLSKAGLYQLTYQGIRDPSGNIADSKTRFVQVTDNTPPELFCTDLILFMWM